MRPDADVLIVGAGPAGSAAAIRLARNGYRVSLLDRAKFPRDKPCGDYCDPGAVRALQELGCLSDLLYAGAATIAGMRIVAQDGTELSASFPSGSGLLFPRMQLDHSLVQRAAREGAEVVENFQVDQIAVTPSEVEVRDLRGRRLRSLLLIAADGMRSVTARRLGLYSDLAGGRFTVGAYFDACGAGPRGELHLGPGYYCGVARFDRRSANVCMALPPERLRGHTPEQAFKAALRDLPALADDLAAARRVSAFRCSGPVGFRASQTTADRVMLAGDAAMQIDPMTGQGIFLALHSGLLAAETAAAALASGDLSQRALQAYPRRRAAEFGRKLTVARMLQFLALRPRLTPRLVKRLQARPDLASQLLGATGDAISAESILRPKYLWRLLISHASSA